MHRDKFGTQTPSHKKVFYHSPQWLIFKSIYVLKLKKVASAFILTWTLLFFTGALKKVFNFHHKSHFIWFRIYRSGPSYPSKMSLSVLIFSCTPYPSTREDYGSFAQDWRHVFTCLIRVGTGKFVVHYKTIIFFSHTPYTLINTH